MKVFLGGTCNESTWRDELMPRLDKFGIDYFNPVVEDWTDECQEEERVQKNQICDVHLYVITPRMTGVFSIAEIIESAFNQHKDTIVMIMAHDGDLSFDKGQMKSLDAVCRMARHHGATICPDFESVVSELLHIKQFKDDLAKLYHKHSYYTPHTNGLIVERPIKTNILRDEA